MKLLFSTILLFISLASYSQITYSGRVNYDDGGAAANLSVVLRDSKYILAYATTDADGRYTLKNTADGEIRYIEVAGAGIKKVSKQVSLKSQEVNFTVIKEVMQIREVTVLAPPMSQRGDTINYTVSRFADQKDRTIEEVMQKMPGIDIKESGQISYQGKSINKFYIEGMDMLGGRYRIATTNISAKDIATVQVYENHQPIKMLRGVKQSDRAAINLKLKSSVIGAWNANFELGGGYEPAMWSAEAVATLFARRMQSIITYKSNNVGEDLTGELNSLIYGGFMSESPLVLSEIYSPSVPQINEERYLQNKTHVASVNTIFKLDSLYFLTVYGDFQSNNELFTGEGLTEYFMPSDTTSIREKTVANFDVKKANFDIKLEGNGDKFYLNNMLRVNGEWRYDRGGVRSNGDDVSQNYDHFYGNVSNQFKVTKKIDDFYYEISSYNAYNNSPSNLKVSPLLYGNLYDSALYDNLMQSTKQENFKSINTISTNFSVKRWTIGLNGALSGRFYWLDSELAPEGVAADNLLRNDQYSSTLSASLIPNARYKRDHFSLEIFFPVSYQFTELDDKLRSEQKSAHDVLISPFVSVIGNISPVLKYNFSASFTQSQSPLSSQYNGFIMENYRTISMNQGVLERRDIGNYSARLSYNDVPSAFLATASASYHHSKSNVLHDLVFSDNLMEQISYFQDNYASGYNFGVELSKRVDCIATTFKLNSSYSWNTSQIMREGDLLGLNVERLSVGGGFISNFTRALRLDYSARWVKNFMDFQGEEYQSAPIETLHQSAAFHWFTTKELSFSVMGEHYFNSALSSESSRNVFFLDFEAEYKLKRWTFALEGRNLLGVANFYNSTYGEAMAYTYSYALRPRSVIAKVRFMLK